MPEKNTCTGKFPDGTVVGIRTLTCTTPETKPGASPQNKTGAGSPLIRTFIVASGRGVTGGVGEVVVILPVISEETKGYIATLAVKREIAKLNSINGNIFFEQNLAHEQTGLRCWIDMERGLALGCYGATIYDRRKRAKFPSTGHTHS
jgi:hypothetical protein